MSYTYDLDPSDGARNDHMGLLFACASRSYTISTRLQQGCALLMWISTEDESASQTLGLLLERVIMSNNVLLPLVRAAGVPGLEARRCKGGEYYRDGAGRYCAQLHESPPRKGV